MPVDLKTHDIKGVEVFSAGKWNGDIYTESDLDEMVVAFNQTNRTWRPYLKLGHDDNQQILQNDGYPVAGWIKSLYRIGNKLVADFSDLPDKLYKLINARAYNRVSCEIYWNIKINENTYPRFLSAVALLGSDMPAVQSLNDIISMYALDAHKVLESKKVYDKLSATGTVKRYDIQITDPLEDEMPENQENADLVKLQGEAQTLREQNEKLAADLKKFTVEADEKSAADAAELETLKKFRIEAEKKFKEDADRLAKADVDAKVSGLLTESLITPAMKPYVEALLGEEKKEYALTIADKEEKLSKFDLLKSALKLAAALNVNTSEGTESGVETKGGDEAKIAEIREYAAKHKVSYGAAYKAVTKQ